MIGIDVLDDLFEIPGQAGNDNYCRAGPQPKGANDNLGQFQREVELSPLSGAEGRHPLWGNAGRSREQARYS